MVPPPLRSSDVGHSTSIFFFFSFFFYLLPPLPLLNSVHITEHFTLLNPPPPHPLPRVSEPGTQVICHQKGGAGGVWGEFIERASPARETWAEEDTAGGSRTWTQTGQIQRRGWRRGRVETWTETQSHSPAGRVHEGLAVILSLNKGKVRTKSTAALLHTH